MSVLDRGRLFRLYIGIVYGLLLIPPAYNVYLSFYPTPSPIILVPDSFTTEWFTSALTDPLIQEAVKTSILVSTVSAVVTASMAIIGARGYMKLRSSTVKRWLVVLFLTPVFIPGIVLGLGLLFYFEALNIEPGLVSLVIVGIVWSLPFAMLIMLTAMSNLDTTLRQASYDLGASPLYTFRRVELPILKPGLLASFFFPFLFVFNEYIRSSFVNGQRTTTPIYIFGYIRGGGLPPEVYAVGTIMVTTTTIGLLAYTIYFLRS